MRAVTIIFHDGFGQKSNTDGATWTGALVPHDDDDDDDCISCLYCGAFFNTLILQRTMRMIVIFLHNTRQRAIAIWYGMVWYGMVPVPALS
eukprot:scaffold5126_cov190-Amphora_coffeaeformis.AAC.4